MSSYLYSGNSATFTDTIKKFQEEGYRVTSQEGYDARQHLNFLHLKVQTEGGGTINSIDLADYDTNVLYNTATSWLKGLLYELRHWK